MKILKDPKYIVAAAVVLIVVVALTLQNHSSPPQLSSTPSIELQNPNGQNQTTTPAPTLTGIIVGDIGINEVTLTAYDPANGSVTSSRQFNTQGFGIPTFNRQAFNKDYTWMAVSQAGSDGSSHIGYIDQSRNFTNLTPSSSYSNIPNQTKPYFDLNTGRIWFVSGSNRYGSVDPKIGASSSRNEQSPANSGTVSPDGKTLVGFSIGLSEQGGGFDITNTASGSTTSVPTSQGDDSCLPEVFIDNNSFVCVQASHFGMGDPTPNSQLYKITLSANRRSITTVPLLPPNNRAIIDGVGNPSGTQVAFISQSGNINTLYTISASGGGEPQKVIDLITSDGLSQSQLISWEE